MEVHLLKVMRYPYIVTYRESFMEKMYSLGLFQVPLHSYGLLRRWRHVPQDSETKITRKTFPWVPNYNMVCTNGPRYELCAWQKDFAQGSQNAKYFPFIQGRYQDWGFRYCQSPTTHLWLRQYCHWNSILSFALNLPGKTLQSKIWYLEFGLHLLWNRNT